MWTNRQFRYLIGVVLVGLVAAACSSADETDVAASTSGAAAEPSAEATSTESMEPTVAATSVATPEPEPDVDEATPEPDPDPDPESQSEAAVVTTIPQADDPCVTPADHVVDGPNGEGEFVEYGFAFEGVERPVGVRVFGEEALTDSPVVWVGLHGEPFSWHTPANVITAGFQTMPAPDEPVVNHVIFSPQAQPGEAGFWTESATFNVDFLEAFMSEVARSVCLDEATVIAVGLAEGAFAIAQAMCTVDLGLDIAILISGIVATEACQPPATVPILSFDLLDQIPEVGKYWGGTWNAPGLAFELSGPMGPTAHEFETWSQHYNCTAPTVAEDVPGESGPTFGVEVLINRNCDATLVAFGLPSDGPDSGGSFGAAFVDVWPRVAVEFQLALEA